MRGRWVAGLQVEEVAVKGAHEKQLEEGAGSSIRPPLDSGHHLRIARPQDCAAANDGRSDPVVEVWRAERGYG
ncbi:MAG: hypothetical protein ACR2LG_11050 [Actinomycetota bacterium]|nr:hypothetical protein [Actinomycetota bacterium]